MSSELITKDDVEGLLETVRNLYLADSIPWVVGYSGGKDSSATLQLVWLALEGLEPSRRRKLVHVIHTDTMVESPIVEKWARSSLERMQARAREKKLPVVVHRLTPDPDQTFWVNLLGRGYPFPRKKYRWCTDRMKIKPVNNFIRGQINENGEIILVLGTRKAESARRARNMARYEKKRVRELLSPNPTLANELVFSPISEWTDDDVWLFLMQYDNPWGYSNNELLTLYMGATADNECPMMVEKDLPSCGKSRFGCWMCTMVSEDKSMAAMINNDPEKQWLAPLLSFRNRIADEEGDLSKRSFRKMNGTLRGDAGRLHHGPYKREVRQAWLEELLRLQLVMQEECPEEYSDFELITREELAQIRKIWVLEKHEFEDAVPGIYERVTGLPYGEDPGWTNPTGLDREDWRLLMEVCAEVAPDEELAFEMAYTLLDIEARSVGLSQRKGLLEGIEKAVRKCSYKNEEDAMEFYSAACEREGRMRMEIEGRAISHSDADEFEEEVDE